MLNKSTATNPPSQLKVRFDTPEHGWIGVELYYGDNVLKFSASYTPIDSIFELITAIAAVKAGREAKVRWHIESPMFVFSFIQSTHETVWLQVEEYLDTTEISSIKKMIFEAQDSRELMCLIFWREIKRLQSTLTPAEYEARWHHQFPSEAFERLTKLIKPESFAL